MKKISFSSKSSPYRTSKLIPLGEQKNILRVASLLGFMLIIFLTAFFLLGRYEKEVRKSTGIAVQSVLKSTHQTMKDLWFKKYFEYAEAWASNKTVINQTENIYSISRDKESLITSKYQKRLRQFFTDRLKQQDVLGVLIISRNYVNLFSTQDIYVGDTNIMAVSHKIRFAKVFNGEVQIIPPVHSQVPLPNKHGNLVEGYPTMFVLAPIRNHAGQIIAALSIRINPFKEFSRIAQTGRFGSSGETYCINSSGDMITESRFTKALSKIGLLKAGESSLLNIEIRNPGGDMVKGFKPTLPRDKQPFTYAVQQLRKKRSGSNIEGYRDYRGVPVIGAWLWDNDLNIGFITEIDESEAMQPYYNTRTITLGLLGVTLLLSIVFLIVLQLITKQSNRRIQENEEKFRGISSSAKDAIIMMDDKGEVSFWNAAAENIFGWSAEETMGRELHKIIIPNRYYQEYIKGFHKFLQSGEGYFISNTVELAALRKDGSEFPIEISISAIMLKGKWNAIGIMRDITERKEAEKNIRKLNALSDNALSLTKSGFWHIDYSTPEYYYSSEKASRIYGELPAKDWKYHLMDEWYSRIAEADEDIARQTGEIYQKAVDGKIEKYDAIYPYKRPVDGKIIWVRAIGDVTRDKDGNALFMYGVVQDITQSKLAEEEIKRLNTAIEQSPVSVIITDIDGVIQYVNPNFTKVTGYTYDEAIGQNPRILKSGEHEEAFYKNIWETLISGKTWAGEIINKKKNGEKYWESASISPVLDKKGKIKNFIAVKTDITEKKKAEKELSKINYLSNRALALSKSVFWTFNLTSDRKIIFSERGDRFFGLKKTADNEYDRSIWEKGLTEGNPEIAKAAGDLLQKAIKNPNIKYDIEFPYKRRDNGKIIWVHSVGDVIRDETGNPLYVLGVMQDITTKKITEEKIKENEAQLKTLVNTIPGTVFQCLINKDWTTLFISKEVEKLTGYPASDFIQNKVRTFESLIHPEDNAMLNEIVSKATDNHESYTVEYRIFDSKGKVRYLFEKGQAEYDSEGNPVILDGTIIDITDLKNTQKELKEAKEQAEAALKEVQEKSRTSKVFMDASDPIIIQDLDGNILDLNYETENAYKFKREDLIGKPVKTLVPPEFHGQAEELLERCKRGEKVRNVEGVRWDYYKNKIPVLLTLSQLSDESGKLVAIATIAKDITSQKKVEAELEEERRNLERKVKERTKELSIAQRNAEAATIAKSQFLATMSHEIRTPMNAIIGLTNLALKTNLNPKQFDYLVKIDRSAQLLLGIINDILDFSKIEAGKLGIEQINFDLDQVMGTVSNLISQKAMEKGLEFAIHINKDVPLFLIGDPLRIGQVITNFCSNAVKFTEKGEVVISVDVARRTKDKIVLEFSVRDTGIGLSVDQQKKMFKSFSQADQSTTRKYGGTGLGLAISKKLVELMNGEIWLNSEPGHGSTFYFTAELGIQKDQKNKEYTPAIDLRGMKVLICDDNATAREILTEALETFSFKVTAVESGEAAIGLLMKQKNDPYKLVLMDWKMPVMNGLEASRIIKQDKKIKTPMIIMVSAFGREEIAEQAEKIGVNAFLNKPVTYSMLFDTIMDVFGKDARTKRQKLETKSKHQNSLKKIRGANILLTEDNEINQQVATELLEDAGFNVDVANNGQESVDIIKSQSTTCKYQLVLMDLQMPVLDGYEATKIIRTLKGAEELPIIAMTADAMAGVKEKCLSIGMQDFVNKPIDPDELLGALVKWIKPGNKPFAKRKPVIKEKVADIDIPDIPGLSIANALKSMNNKRQLYLNVLEKFYHNNQNIVFEVKDAIDKQDYDTARRLIHTLKGVSGSIGADALHALTKVVESSILNKDKEKFEHEINKLEVEIKALFESISSKLDFGKRDQKKPLNIVLIKEIIPKFEQLLKVKNPRAKALLKDLMNAGLSGDLYDELVIKLNKYDFKNAMKILDEIKKTLI